MAVQNHAALLVRLAQEGECQWLELKNSNDDPNRIGRYVSALANAAMLHERDRAFLVFGVDDKTRELVGTSVKLKTKKVGGEIFENWLNRMIEPRLMLELSDFEYNSKNYSIIIIEPTYDRPVRFSGTEYMRIGENLKKLAEYPGHERALWLATGRRKFEDAVALSNQAAEDVLRLLDTDCIYELSERPKPKSPEEIIRQINAGGSLVDNFEGGYDITNLGAILFARNLENFPSLKGKSIRIMKYTGKDKRKTEFEQEVKKGYAVGFKDMIRLIMQSIPSEEVYVDGVRRKIPIYPEIAIREIVSNALIHQDFTVTGSGPVVEIFSNRIEVNNPGGSLIQIDRILDERSSRNEKLARTMRDLGLCEERGGGVDKTIIEVEELHLPAPEFVSTDNSMKVILFGPRPFGEMSKKDKQRACFFHCVRRWMEHDFMNNTSLRERFSLPQSDYQSVSAIISEAIKNNRIAPAEPNQGRRNARYIPYFAA